MTVDELQFASVIVEVLVTVLGVLLAPYPEIRPHFPERGALY
jgi:hypothetical protein